MTTAETYSPGEYKGLLRADFASFAQHCFRELNPRTPFAPNWHHEFIAAEIGGSARRPDPATDHQHAAAPPEVAPGFGRFSGLVSRARTRPADPLRQLCAGPRRQTLARLPADRRQRLVRAA